MDYENQIKDKLGLKSVAEFARYLGAPVRTIYAYIKGHRGVKSPASMKWKWGAYIDAVKYRALSVTGWKCKSCGAITTSPENDGRKPLFCGDCGGSTNFTPVRIVDESLSAGWAERQCVCGHSWVGGPQNVDENCPKCNPPNQGANQGASHGESK